MMKLYGYPQTRSTRVAWALEETGAEYEYGLINLKAGEHKQPAFLAINPFGKIPSLVDDGHVMSESSAICTYIAEKFPAAKRYKRPCWVFSVAIFCGVRVRSAFMDSRQTRQAIAWR